jgi:hypothetical protein
MTESWQGAPPPVQALLGAAIVSPASQAVLNAAMRTPGMHMVCTNVPGPQIPLYARGSRIISHYPLLPVAPGMGLNMGVFSYNHKLHFGYITDTAAAPDVEFFARCVDEGFAELRDAAGVQQLEPIEIGSARRTPSAAKNGARQQEPATFAAGAKPVPSASPREKSTEAASTRAAGST